MSAILSLLWIVHISTLHSAKPAHIANFECRWVTPNATFNLCELQLTSTTENTNNKAYYEVFDNRASALYNFTYIFNVCNDIESYPPDEICWNNTLRDRPDKMMPTGYCTEFNETNGDCIDIEDITAMTAAYQVHRGRHTEEDPRVHDCYRLHNGIDAPVFSYIEPSDPSIGVRLTYANGDWCPAGGINREFSLEFYCDEMLENVPDKKEEIIYENEICSYVLPIYTGYGCPEECPISGKNNKLCDGHGVCDFDYTNNVSQCYCYYGHCGADCSETNCAKNSQKLYNITAPNDEESCLFELTDSFGMKAYYNLSYFNLKNENFIVDDALDREYVYKFNICGEMQLFDDATEVPQSCVNYNHGPCTYYDISEYTYDNITKEAKWCDNTYDTFDSNSVAKAVQIFYPKTNKSEPMCYWLGMSLPDGFDMVSYDISLIDQNDTGRGVVWKILNGQYCEEGQRNRELNVILRCPDTKRFSFDPEMEAKTILNESVFESDTCIYEIEIESPLACPMQCISRKRIDGKEEFSVCSSRGICASDPEASQIRCICDGGYTGINCEKSVLFTTTNGGDNSDGNGSSDSGNGVSIGVGIGIAFLVLIMVGIFFYLQKKKKDAVSGISGYLQGSDGLINESQEANM